MIEKDVKEEEEGIKPAQSSQSSSKKNALGFKQQVSKLLIIVQLLLGEIPSRTFFKLQTLYPYFQLSTCIRQGNVKEFEFILASYQNIFKQDDTFTLIQRLRHNVIKAGLRKILFHIIVFLS